MKGIRLSHGVVFVFDGVHTVRLSPSGKCEPSPITYHTLEHELQTEPPHTWEYLTEGDIRGLDGFAQIENVFRTLQTH